MQLPAISAFSTSRRTLASASVRRSGIALTLRTAGPNTRLRLTAKLGKKTVGTLTKTVAKAGKATLRLKLSRAGKALLKRKRGKVAINVTGTAAGFRTTTLKLSVSVRRWDPARRAFASTQNGAVESAPVGYARRSWPAWRRNSSARARSAVDLAAQVVNRGSKHRKSNVPGSGRGWASTRSMPGSEAVNLVKVG